MHPYSSTELVRFLFMRSSANASVDCLTPHCAVSSILNNHFPLFTRVKMLYRAMRRPQVQRTSREGANGAKAIPLRRDDVEVNVPKDC